MGQRWLLYVSTWFLQLNCRNSFSVAHRRYESFHRYVTRDAHTNTKSDNYTEHADRLLVFMRIPVRKSQFDFRIYRIDFCHEALLMRIPLRKPKSTSHHPLGSYIIIKRVSRSGRSVLVRSTLYRGPVAEREHESLALIPLLCYAL